MKKIFTLLSLAALLVSCSKKDELYPAYTGYIQEEAEVDLGLSVVWSGFNVGAAKVTDAGKYFAWGEWTPADLGEGWAVPTPAQLAELCDPEKCSVVKASYKGVNGWVVTSKIIGYDGNSIFFPAAGYWAVDHVNNFGTQGAYWSNALVSGSETRAQNLFFDGNAAYMNVPPKGVGGTTWCGYPLRAVKTK